MQKSPFGEGQPDKRRRGVSLVELLLTIGIIAIISTVMLVNLLGRRNTTELNLAGQRITALLREAQSRAMSQASSTTWGVRFDNTNAAAPFAALFSGAYSTSSREDIYLLPAGLQFAASFLPAGSSTSAVFVQITGRPLATSSVRIASRNSTSTIVTITVDSSGAVAY
jgi:prepilin-type N-terminal cleavage/methylation domain-containing protein